MNIKQKIIRGKDEQPKSRYSVQLKKCNSASSLLKAKEFGLQNKENNIFQFNNNSKKKQLQQSVMLQKSCQFEVLTSMELSKRLKTSIEDEQKPNLTGKGKKEGVQDLKSSQEMFIFRQKNPANLIKSTDFGEHLTFGSVSKKWEEGKMVTSRQFVQQKKVKNDVIDEMFVNARRCLVKSVADPGIREGMRCVNHSNKTAKYRLTSELQEGQQEMFYCSKCAINLLQRGFKIEEVKFQDTESQSRIQQISKFELKLKNLQQRTLAEINKKENKEKLNCIQQGITSANQQFASIIKMLENLWSSSINKLKDELQKGELEHKLHKQSLAEVAKSIFDLQKQITQYRNTKKFAIMKENEFNFISTSLDNKINRFDEMLKTASMFPLKQQPCVLPNLDYQSILDKLKQSFASRQEPIYINNRGEMSFEKKKNIEGGHHQQDFVCDEKQPFRTLFPCEQTDLNLVQTERQQRCDKRSLLYSVRECPSFKKHP